jgi:hypothetical protein
MAMTVSGAGGSRNPFDDLLIFGGKVDHLSDEQLKEELANPRFKEPIREKVIAEMIKRLDEKIASGEPEPGQLRQRELLQKLKDGTITQTENYELGEHLSIKIPYEEK